MLKSIKYTYNFIFIFILLFWILFYLITSFIFAVKDGNVAVITTFGKVTGESRKPGLNIIFPFIQKYHFFSVKTQVVPEQFTTLTLDQQVIEATATIKYRLKGDRAGDLYSEISYTDANIYKRVVYPTFQNTFKAVFSKYPLVKIASQWNEISLEIEKQVAKEINNNKKTDYIEVQGLEITGLVIDEDYRNAIEEKQIAEQKFLKAQIEVRIAKLEAEKFKILGEKLDNRVLYKLFLDKWNGQTAVVPGINDSSRVPVIVNSNK